MEQMNTVNHIAICVFILLVLFVTNGVGGNYLLSLGDDYDDTSAIEKVVAFSHKIPTNNHLVLRRFFAYVRNITVLILSTQTSSGDRSIIFRQRDVFFAKHVM
jgi:hypothetical protein